MINPKLNCQQVACLRDATPIGKIPCDASIGMALTRRGFATEVWLEGRRIFMITDAGRARAKKAADINEHNGHSGNPESFYAEMLRDQEAVS